MMRIIVSCAVAVLLWSAGSVAVAAQPPVDRGPAAQGQPQQQDEFVPIDQLPPEEQMPAAPMVVAAYGFIWVAFMAYVFTLVKRVQRVEEDLRRLEQGRG